MFAANSAMPMRKNTATRKYGVTSAMASPSSKPKKKAKTLNRDMSHHQQSFIVATTPSKPHHTHLY